jgi:hypothetical protein
VLNALRPHVQVMSRLTATQRIHALRNCLDRDVNANDFTPWTQVWGYLCSRQLLGMLRQSFFALLAACLGKAECQVSV